MKVFVTGHKGYIGSHLVELLKLDGHYVTGCDLGLFDGCGWEDVVPADRDLNKDVRHVTMEDLTGHDCVMHLAALSNDPMGEVNAAATFAINRDASIRVAQLAKKVPEYLRRHSIPPGITGLAQVQRSYDASLDDVVTKLKYDLFYVDNRCLMLNVKILMKTFDVVFRGRGAH
jgi:hypothetical protein